MPRSEDLQIKIVLFVRFESEIRLVLLERKRDNTCLYTRSSLKSIPICKLINRFLNLINSLTEDSLFDLTLLQLNSTQVERSLVCSFQTAPFNLQEAWNEERESTDAKLDSGLDIQNVCKS